MQIHRLFEIVYILLDKKGITSKELAKHFEVSVRTILRDIDTLAETGIPVYTIQGKGGGIYIPDTFILNKTAVTKKEKEEVLLALQSLRAAEYPDIDTTLSRFKSFFNMPGKNWIEVDFSRWGNSKNDKEKFEILKTAILKNEALRINYISGPGEASERTVYPLKLIFKSKAWYLQAYCLSKEGYRTFRVNRILGLELTGKNFPGESYQAPSLDEAGAASSALINLVLSFSPDAASRIYDEFDPQLVHRKKDGSFIIRISMPEDMWFYGFLLSFGASLEVIKPPQVRENLLKEVKKIQGLYKT